MFLGDREPPPEARPARAAYEGYEDGWNGRKNRSRQEVGEPPAFEYIPELEAYRTAYFWGDSDRREGVRRDYGSYRTAMLREAQGVPASGKDKPVTNDLNAFGMPPPSKEYEERSVDYWGPGKES